MCCTAQESRTAGVVQTVRERLAESRTARPGRLRALAVHAPAGWERAMRAVAAAALLLLRAGVEASGVSTHQGNRVPTFYEKPAAVTGQRQWGCRRSSEAVRVGA